MKSRGYLWVGGCLAAAIGIAAWLVYGTGASRTLGSPHASEEGVVAGAAMDGGQGPSRSEKTPAGATQRVPVADLPPDERGEVRAGTRQTVVVVDAAGAPVAQASVHWASVPEMQERVRSLGEAARDLGGSPVQSLVRVGDSAHADESGSVVLTTVAVPPLYVAAVTAHGWGLSAFTQFTEEPWRVVHEPHRVLRVAVDGARAEDVPVILRWDAPDEQTGVVNGKELGRVRSPGVLVRADYEMVEAQVRKPRPDASNFEIALVIAGGPLVAEIRDDHELRFDFHIPGPVRSVELEVVDSDGRVIETADGRVTIRHDDSKLMWYSVRAGRALLPCAAVGKVAQVAFTFPRAPTWDAELQVPAQGPVVVASRSHAVVTGRVISGDGPVPERLDLGWDGGSVAAACETAGRFRATVPAALTRIELLGGDRSAGVDLAPLDPSRTTDLGVIALARHTTLSLSIQSPDGAEVLDASIGVQVGHRVWKVERAQAPVAIDARPGDDVLVAIKAPGCVAKRLELVAGAQDRTEVVVLDRAGSVRGRIFVPAGFASDVRVLLRTSAGDLHAPDRAERTAEGFDVAWESFPVGEAVAHLVSERPELLVFAVPVRVGGDGVSAFELDGRHIDLRRVVLQLRPTALALDMVLMRAQSTGSVAEERWVSGFAGSLDEALVLDANCTYVLVGPKCAASYVSGGVRSPHKVELRPPQTVRVSGADLAWHLRPRSDDFDLRKVCRRVHFADGRVFCRQTSLGDIVGSEPRLLYFPCVHDVVVSGGSSHPEVVGPDGGMTVVLRAN